MMACGTRELKAHPEAADRMCAGAETAEEKEEKKCASACGGGLQLRYPLPADSVAYLIARSTWSLRSVFYVYTLYVYRAKSLDTLLRVSGLINSRVQINFDL